MNRQKMQEHRTDTGVLVCRLPLWGTGVAAAAQDLWGEVGLAAVFFWFAGLLGGSGREGFQQGEFRS